MEANFSLISSGDFFEILFRKKLWSLGYRYRKNYKKLPGKPDIVFVSKKVAIFIDGEFWHGKDWDIRKYDIKSNKDFWISKIEHNMNRDKKVNDYLISKGWVIFRFWGKDVLKNPEKFSLEIQKAIYERCVR